MSRTNVNYVFLAGTLNIIFVLFDILPQYLATVMIRGVVRTLSGMIKLFAKIGNGF